MQEERGPTTPGGTAEVLKAVMDTSPLAVIALDRTGVVRLWSIGSEKMFGWTEREVLGKPLPTVPPDLEAEYRRLLETQFQGAAYQAIETNRLRKDGARIPVELWTAPVYDTSGEVTIVVNLIADVTARKQSEVEHKALAAREQEAQAEALMSRRFYKLLESAPDAIFEVDICRQPRPALAVRNHPR